MFHFHKPGCGSDQIYLRLTPSAAPELSAHQATMPVRYTRRLDIRSKVADQPAGQRAIRDDALDAIANARRGVKRGGVEPRDYAGARSYRAGGRRRASGRAPRGSRRPQGRGQGPGRRPGREEQRHRRPHGEEGCLRVRSSVRPNILYKSK